MVCHNARNNCKFFFKNFVPHFPVFDEVGATDKQYWRFSLFPKANKGQVNFEDVRPCVEGWLAPDSKLWTDSGKICGVVPLI